MGMAEMMLLKVVILLIFLNVFGLALWSAIVYAVKAKQKLEKRENIEEN